MASFQVAIVVTFDTEVVKTREDAEVQAKKLADNIPRPYYGMSPQVGIAYDAIYIDTRYDDFPEEE